MRGGATTHRDEVAYAARDVTISALRAIGRTYKRNTGNLLTYNDISLPKGGIFEAFPFTNPFQSEWVAPHAEHRTGQEIDINRRRDASGIAIRCDMETGILAAVDVILTPRPNGKSALLCETIATGFRNDPGTYHLNVTNLKLLSGFQNFTL